MSEYGHGLLGAPDDSERSRFQWLHIRPGDLFTIILGDKLPLWYKAHWYGGRMMPCSGSECRMCDAGVGRQRRWVFAVAIVSQHRPYLWEVSEALAQEIRVIGELHGTFTNLRLQVSREGTGNKGRIKVLSKGIDEYHGCEGIDFPEPQEALELTWATLPSNSESSAPSKSPIGAASQSGGHEGREY